MKGQEAHRQAALAATAESGQEGGLVATGVRREFSAQVKSLVELRGDQVREGLADEQTVREYVEAIKRGVRLNSRTELREYARIMRLVDAEVRVVHEFLLTMGVKSESELRGMVETLRSAEGSDTLTALERMTTAMEAILPLHEEHRGMVIRRLGGYLPTRVEDTHDGAGDGAGDLHHEVISGA